jgi:uncharacterized Fe-S cluster protein YjdI
MSSDREIIKEYSNEGFTVIWKAKMCIHAAECVKRLPKVYNPNAKPWITIKNATSEELISQINACPSGALTYKSNNIKKTKKLNELFKVIFDITWG